MGGDLIKEARKRTGLTQAELATRAGTTQSAIARWEAGVVSPSFDNVRRLVSLCGLALVVELERWEDGLRDDLDQAHDVLAQAPERRAESRASVIATYERLRRRVRNVPALRVDKLLEVLLNHSVEFIVIGSFGAALHGSPFTTFDLDLTPSGEPSNLDRLEQALVAMAARPRPREPGEERLAPARSDEHSIRYTVTRYGKLDVVGRPTGTSGYEDLRREASSWKAFGMRVNVASLADIVRSKAAANRNTDRRMLPVLRELLAEQTAALRRRV